MLAGKGKLRAWNSRIQRYNQNEPQFNGDCSRNNFEWKIKDGVYVVNPDKFANIRTH